MGETERAVPICDLYLEGSRVPVSVDQSIISLAIDVDADMATDLRLELNNEGSIWSDSDYFDEGQALKADLGFEDGETSTVAEVEIVGARAVFPMQGPCTYTVVGRCREHFLGRTRHARSFQEMSASDIVKKIAGEAGLSADVDSTEPTYPYVFQNNQTDLEFCRMLARAHGHELEVDQQKLVFKKPRTSGRPISTMTRGETLQSFHPRVSLSSQVHEVRVRGWDPAEKKEILGKASAGDLLSAVGTSTEGPKKYEDYLGSVGHEAGKVHEVVVDEPIRTTAEADTRAKALLNEKALGFVMARGTCVGEPTLLPGKMFEVKGIGERFAGSYYLDGVRHVYTKEGFKTWFRASRPGVDVPEEVPKPPPPPEPQKSEPPESAGMRASWSVPQIPIGEKVDIIVPVQGIEDGQSVTLDIYKKKTPSLGTAGFSKLNAEPGETVELSVNAENLDDGETVKIKVKRKPPGGGEGGGAPSDGPAAGGEEEAADGEDGGEQAAPVAAGMPPGGGGGDDKDDLAMGEEDETYDVQFTTKFDPDDPYQKDETVTLEAADGSFSQTVPVADADDAEGGKALKFVDVQPGKVYSLKVDPGLENEPFYVFKDVEATEELLKDISTD